jgi:hypothetical protein
MSNRSAICTSRCARPTTALLALFVASLLLHSPTSAQTAPGTNTTTEAARAEEPAPMASKTTAQIPSAPRGKSGGLTVAAFTGGAHTLDSPLTISQPGLGTQLVFRDVRFDGRSFEPPLYYGFRGGYFLRRRLSVGVEAEFIHLKIYSDPTGRVRATGTRRGARHAGSARHNHSALLDLTRRQPAAL